MHLQMERKTRDVSFSYSHVLHVKHLCTHIHTYKHTYAHTRSDIILGAPYASPNGKKNSGRIVVIFGRHAYEKWPRVVYASSLQGYGFVVNGARAMSTSLADGLNDMAGWAVGQHVGDVNGDMIK